MSLARAVLRSAGRLTANSASLVPRRGRLAAGQQTRSLHKNKFLEEWDGSKIDLHKTFKLNKSTTTTIFTLIAVIPTLVFMLILEEEKNQGNLVSQNTFLLPPVPKEDEEE
mmetsp:Transcript_22131/g.39248  ORF Transcript_22131/g.39248 Transcript_22131/m.39248 type:complete len:111 (-) Transcript_22131:69-401(-)|eukprot:CAMPEP_0184519924 /NCGR_PEP_ID=MMETSP0198_2-20121128/6889_1 /TAXON_ID=1112570 /ORGANISM="Thraustochytrium sp., Strain LLF1b" /LENGTH=110 /DNA_ID=CAMNT_0026910479 /DNA_START=126 /DNA_END=458 /DNA_ORIENTATION=+